MFEWNKEIIFRPVIVRQYHKQKVKADVPLQTDWLTESLLSLLRQWGKTSERMGGIWAQPDTK